MERSSSEHLVHQLSQSTIRSRWFGIAVTILIFSTIFQHVISVPHFGYKIQLTELLFVPVLLLFPYRVLMQLQWNRNDKIIFISLCAYLVANLVSSLLSGNLNSIAESAGRIYLGLFCVVLVVFFLSLTKERCRFFIASIFFHMGWVLSLIAICGYLLGFAGIENNLVIRLDEYPYLGTVYRLRGPTYTPTMFCTLLAPAIFFPLSEWKQLPFKKNVRIVLMTLILIAAVLSFSKSLLIIVWGLALMLLFRFGKLNGAWIFLTAIPMIGFLFIATHFVLAKPGSTAYERYMNTTFVSDQISFTIGDWHALETSYYLNKKIALELFVEQPVFGIGTGNFNNYVDLYKSRGLYPQRFFSYDPHSTWLGALAENGITGTIAIILFLFFVFRPYFHFSRIYQNQTSFAVFLICCFFLIEGIATDIFNFRHFWIVVAAAFSIAKHDGLYVGNPKDQGI